MDADVTALHRLNPLTKLIIAAALTLGAWLTSSVILTAALAALVLALIVVFRVPESRGFFKVVATMILVVSTMWTVSLYLQGTGLADALLFGLRFALRFVVTTASFFIVMQTTTAGPMLAACSRVSVPRRLALSIALVIGLIPLLRANLRTINDAQRARGVELDRGPLPKRLILIVSSSIPLMMQSFNTAEGISTMLSLQGFGHEGRRTSWRMVGPLHIQSTLEERNRE